MKPCQSFQCPVEATLQLIGGKYKSLILPIISSPKSLIFGLFSLNSYLTTSAKVHEHSLYQVLNS